MNPRRFFSLLLATVAVLLLGGLGSWVWILTQSPLQLLGEAPPVDPAAVMFIPRQAPAMVSLQVHPDELLNLRQVMAGPSQRQRTRQEFRDALQGLVASTSLDYERDIRPWLGSEITGAMTSVDLDRDRSNGLQPGYLLAIATADSQRAREFLELFWQRQAAATQDLQIETYKGTTLIHSNQALIGKKSQAIATAVVGQGYVLFANHPKVLRDAITNAQVPELNLAHTPAYEQQRQSLGNARLGLAHVNLDSLSSWGEARPKGEAQGETQGETLGGPMAETLPDGGRTTLGSLSLGFGLTRQGLRIDTSLPAWTAGTPAAAVPVAAAPVAASSMAPKPATAAEPLSSSTPSALQPSAYLPRGTSLVLQGADLGTFWQTLTDQLQHNSSLRSRLSPVLQRLDQTWGVPVTEAVFPWVRGDFVLAQVQRNQGERRLSDWVFAVRQGKEVTQGLQKLAQLTQREGYSPNRLSLGNREVTAWTRLNPRGWGGRGTDDASIEASVRRAEAYLGEYVVLTSSLQAMERVIQAYGGQDGLTSSATFQGAIASLPQGHGLKRHGSQQDGADRAGLHGVSHFGYLDWPRNRARLVQQWPALSILEALGGPLTRNLKAIVLGDRGQIDGIQRASLVLRWVD